MHIAGALAGLSRIIRKGKRNNGAKTLFVIFSTTKQISSVKIPSVCIQIFYKPYLVSIQRIFDSPRLSWRISKAIPKHISTPIHNSMDRNLNFRNFNSLHRKRFVRFLITSKWEPTNYDAHLVPIVPYFIFFLEEHVMVIKGSPDDVFWTKYVTLDRALL